MFKAEKKSHKIIKNFTFNLRLSFYCDYKRIRAYTFVIVNIYKTKYT